MSRRIALYVHRLTISNPTGVHRYALELARALSAQAEQKGDRLEMWSGRDPATAGRGLPGVTTRQLPRRRQAVHATWSAVGRPRIETMTGRLDLVHALLPAFPVASRAPLVLTIHDLLPLTNPDWFARVPLWGFHRSVRDAVRRAAAIISPSQVVVDDVRDRLGVEPARLHLVPEGVDGLFAQPVDPAQAEHTLRRHGVETGRFLVAIGQVSPRKNLEVVFRALAALRSRGRTPPPLVVIGGSDAASAPTHAAPGRLGVADLVRFTGRLDDSDLRALLQHATALVHPSRYEGFGLTPLEAMAAGVPVVASSAGSLPEVVGDAGMLADPDDVTAWAEAIALLQDDLARGEALAAAGRRRAARYTWEEAARRTWEVYEAVLAGR